MADYGDFQKVDIRVGTVTEVTDFPEARKPAYRITVDLGEEIGRKVSSAQLPHNYTKEALQGRQVLCVTNLPPRQIGPVRSEVLILGVPDAAGECILITPDKPVSDGIRLY